MFLTKLSRQNPLALIPTRRLSTLHDRYTFQPPPSLPLPQTLTLTSKRSPNPATALPPLSTATASRPCIPIPPLISGSTTPRAPPQRGQLGSASPSTRRLGRGGWPGPGAGSAPRLWTPGWSDLRTRSGVWRRREGGGELRFRESCRSVPLRGRFWWISFREGVARSKSIWGGMDGLTHNMLNAIHDHWQHEEAVRIKCQGVPTVEMRNVWTQLEEKTFGKIIYRHGSVIILYRGRNYHPKKRPVIPMMLWKPHEPKYPKLIKTTVDGLSIEETKEMRKRGLSVPALIKLARNGYYGNLVPMVRDAFLASDLVRIDCQGLEKSDYKKIGWKLRELVPCILVTFDKEQVVVWKGNNYKPVQDTYFLPEREVFDSPKGDAASCAEHFDSLDDNNSQTEYYSGNDE